MTARRPGLTRVTLWLTAAEIATLDELRAAMPTDDGKRATRTQVLREGLGALSLDLFDRRIAPRPVERERRAAAGRRRYDIEARGRLELLLVNARRQAKGLPPLVIPGEPTREKG